MIELVHYCIPFLEEDNEPMLCPPGFSLRSTKQMRLEISVLKAENRLMRFQLKDGRAQVPISKNKRTVRFLQPTGPFDRSQSHNRFDIVMSVFNGEKMTVDDVTALVQQAFPYRMKALTVRHTLGQLSSNGHLNHERPYYWKKAVALLLLCCLFLAGCAAPKKADAVAKPPIPPPVIKTLRSPKAKTEYSSMVTAASVPKSYQLFWTYPIPMPAAGTVFDIEFTSDVNSPWVKIGEVEMPPYGISTTSSRGFFRVGAHKKKHEN